MIGKKLTPILEEIEDTILEFDIKGLKPCYEGDSLRASCKIFMSVLLDEMWNMQEAENMPLIDRCNMATSAGNDLRKLIKTYTGKESLNFYKNA